MHDTLIQKAGFVVLPHDSSLKRVLEDQMLKVFWTEEDAKDEFQAELVFTDEKHLPTIIPVHVSFPLALLRFDNVGQLPRNFNRNQPIILGEIPNAGQLNAPVGVLPVEEIPIAMPPEGFDDDDDDEIDDPR